MALAFSAALLNCAPAEEKPGVSTTPAQTWADSKPADMTKPVKVFIMLGQSNMVGMGAITRGSKYPLETVVKEEKMYPFLIDEKGNWAERKDVRNVFLLFDYGKTQFLHNEWLRVGGGSGGKMNAKMGTEYGIGHLLGNAFEDPVMLLKCCNGNKSLGFDLLTPGSKGYDFVVKNKKGEEATYTYAGYKESPMRLLKDSKPEPEKANENVHGGHQYDGSWRYRHDEQRDDQSPGPRGHCGQRSESEPARPADEGDRRVCVSDGRRHRIGPHDADPESGHRQDRVCVGG